MASNGSVYSQTLRDITKTKLDELAKKRASFESQRRQITAAAENEKNAVQQVSLVAKGMKACFAVSTLEDRVVRGSSSNPRLEIDLKNLDRFVAQARYDPSISSKILEQWQQTLSRHFDFQSSKFEYASLYGNLTTEWVSAKSKSMSAPVTGGEDTEMDDFEHVSTGKRLDSRVNWERSVFEPKAVNSTAIVTMLHGLFESAPKGSKHLLQALETLRASVARFGRDLLQPRHFNIDTLRWTIGSLLNSDLLDDAKQESLRDFLKNEIILMEIRDVLRMRIAALEDWSWGAEVLLEERRQLNGQYRIYMQEDLLQAIFLHYMGIRWSVFWKKNLSTFRRSPGVWKSSQKPFTETDLKRRWYYLGGMPKGPTFESKRQNIYRKGYFLSQLLDSETEVASVDEGDEEADFEEYAQPQAPSKKRPRMKQTARQSMSSYSGRAAAPSAGRVAYSGLVYDEKVTEDEDNDESIGKPRNAMEAKQNLLHLLSAEILIKTRLRGEITCFRSKLDSLYPSLPHATIQTVLRFLGVSQEWLHFFDQFLKAPLRFADDESAEARPRRNGTPGSHVLSEVFGEVILFCLDFQIDQVTGGEVLWRNQDDFWFWSSHHATCVKAWFTICHFVEVMGLTINVAQSGAVRMARKSDDIRKMNSFAVGDYLPRGQIRWGMLKLNPESGRFEIDQEMVDKHVGELSRQLKDKTDNVFAWIQAWNSYAATFFTSNFGRPANCFGRQHVDNMLATHERIQRQIFASSFNTTDARPGSTNDEGNVIEFLKGTIGNRFRVKDIPDGYFYFPVELGGLEVRNPFVGLLQIRDAVHADPDQLLDELEAGERHAYREAKARFDKHRPCHDQTPRYIPEDADKFFSFEEYIRNREHVFMGFPSELVGAFTTLLRQPAQESIETDDNGNITAALKSLGSQSGLRGILSDWYAMEPYWKWVAQLYGTGMIDKFGGFNIVDPGLLPMGMSTASPMPDPTDVSSPTNSVIDPAITNQLTNPHDSSTANGLNVVSSGPGFDPTHGHSATNGPQVVINSPIPVATHSHLTTSNGHNIVSNPQIIIICLNSPYKYPDFSQTYKPGKYCKPPYYKKNDNLDSTPRFAVDPYNLGSYMSSRSEVYSIGTTNLETPQHAFDANGPRKSSDKSLSASSQLAKHVKKFRTGPSMSDSRVAKSQPQAMSQRTKAHLDRLNATSGIVIPSKLPRGQVPPPNPSKAKDQTNLPFVCPRCKSRYGRPDHVRSHFPSCIEQYGNPEGVKWSDGKKSL